MGTLTSGRARSAWRGGPALWAALVLAGAGCQSAEDGDYDGDGVVDGSDCAPADPNVYPGAIEVLNDGIDQDCDGVDGHDLDRDGFASDVAPLDCGDQNVAVHPGAVEDCVDGLDNDCNGQADAADPACAGDDDDASDDDTSAGDDDASDDDTNSGDDDDADDDDADDDDADDDSADDDSADDDADDDSADDDSADDDDGDDDSADDDSADDDSADDDDGDDDSADDDDGDDDSADDDSGDDDSALAPTLTGIEGWDTAAGAAGSALSIADPAGLTVGVSDPVPAAHRFADAWLLTGERLDEALSAELRPAGGGAAIYGAADGLTLDSGGTSMQRVLRLPPSLAAGTYTLAILAFAGEATAQTFILQGEPGAACWDLDGDHIADPAEDINGDGAWDALDCLGPQGTSGDPGEAGQACWDLDGDGLPTWPDEDTDGDGVVSVADCRSGSDCPIGYVRDASETDLVLCFNTDTTVLGPDEMVRVGDFWVDRYEASVWSESDCTGTAYGVGADDYPAGWPDNGQGTETLFACSVAGVQPAMDVTWFQAQQACVAAGKDLCSSEQWQAAAAGTPDPGAFDGSAGGGCNTSSPAGAPRDTGAAAGQCTSRWGADDLIGNLWELTGDWQITGVPWLANNGATSEPWPVGYGSDRLWNVNGQADNGAGFVEGAPAAVRRGGYYGNGVRAGAFSMHLVSSPAGSDNTTGFRCCRRH